MGKIIKHQVCSFGIDKTTINCNIFLKNDPSLKQRAEDAVISWTWRMFMTIKSDQPEWLLRLPMTKVGR